MRCWGIAVVLAVFFAIAASGQAAAAGAAVSNGAVPPIAISGNRHIGADMIRSYFHPAPDGRLGATELDAALKRLYATGLFKDVKISRAGSRVLVTVVENPTIGVISFEGNKKIKDADLTKAIQSKVNGPLSRETVQSDVVQHPRAVSSARLLRRARRSADDRRPKRRQQGYATLRQRSTASISSSRSKKATSSRYGKSASSATRRFRPRSSRPWSRPARPMC